MASQTRVHRIQSIAGALAIALAPSLCAAATLERVSPDPTTYTQGTDFSAMFWSGTGDVTAQVQAVDLVIPPGPAPNSNTSGCEAADFAGFVPGRIALIQRGTCTFRDKTLNAQAAGATGVIIFNEGQPGRDGVLEGTIGGAGATIPSIGTTFALGSDLNTRLQSGPVVIHMVVGPINQGLSPAKLWIGLKNSDSVGLRVDLEVQILTNGAGGGFSGLLGIGFLENQSTGSSGFNNAQLKTVDLLGGGGEVSSGDELSVKVSARRTCSGPGHKSGTVRLWYNGQPVDSGATRDAGSRFDATFAATNDYFLRGGFALSTTPGSSRLSADAFVNSSSPCPDRPYVEIGTWRMTLP